MINKKSALQEYLDTTSRTPPRTPTTYAPNSVYSQDWQTDFPNSKLECIQQLQKIKQKIRREEETMTSMIKDHQSQVLRQLDRQYQTLKAEICQDLDRAYEESKVKVKVRFQNEGLDQVGSVSKELRGLYFKIEQLLRQLETDSTYKRGIAATVLEDFENKRRAVSAKIRETINRYENFEFLRVDMRVLKQIKDNIGSLFVYSSGDKSRGFGFETLGSFGQTNNFNFKETGNFPELQDIEMQRDESPGIVISPTSQFPEIKSPFFPLKEVERLSVPKNNTFPAKPQLQRQAFSFQPSQVSENQKHIFQSPANTNQFLRQSSAQQFKNSYARQFESQFNDQSSVVQSRVQPFTKQQLSTQPIVNVNPHRNRDLIKKL